MTKNELRTIASAIRKSVVAAAKMGGAASVQGYAMREAADRVAVEIWNTMIYGVDRFNNLYPDQYSWQVACGFHTSNDILMEEAV